MIYKKTKVTIENNFVKTVLIGDYNSERTQSYLKDLEDKVSQIKDNNFGLLLNSNEFEGATANSYKLSEEFQKKLMEMKNFKGKAIVLNNNLYLTMAEFFAPTFKKENIKTFNNEKEAIKWLLNEIEN